MLFQLNRPVQRDAVDVAVDVCARITSAILISSQSHSAYSEAVSVSPSDVVLETRVLVSRRIEDKNESLGLRLGS